MYRLSSPVIGIPDKYNILPRGNLQFLSIYLEILLEVVGGNPQKAPFSSASITKARESERLDIAG
jgi:hypothetical protein